MKKVFVEQPLALCGRANKPALQTLTNLTPEIWKSTFSEKFVVTFEPMMLC